MIQATVASRFFVSRFIPVSTLRKFTMRNAFLALLAAVAVVAMPAMAQAGGGGGTKRLAFGRGSTTAAGAGLWDFFGRLDFMPMP